MEIKELRFSHIITHTFPGIIIAIEILIGIDLLTSRSVIHDILQSLRDYPGLAIVMLVSFLVVATIIGIVVDAMSYFILHYLFGKNPLDDFKGCKVIKNFEQLGVYKYVVEEWYYNYYEAYINTAVVIAPGIVVIPLCLPKIGITVIFALASGFLLFCVVCLLFMEAYITYNDAVKMDNEFAESMKELKRK